MIVRIVGPDVTMIVTPDVLPPAVVAMVTVADCVIVMMNQFVTVVLSSISRYEFCDQ